MTTRGKITRLLLIAGVLVLLDQLTKALIGHYLQPFQSITVIPGFFNLIYIHNPGGAFGFLAGSDPIIRKVVFIFVSLMAVGLILWYYMKTPAGFPFLSGAFAMIFGGAIGNLIDRIRIGKVVDFLDFYIGSLHWPAFNVADSAITIGIGIFILHLLLKKLPE
jgi:signal peptidase II